MRNRRIKISRADPEQPGFFVEWYQRCITGDESFRSSASAQILPNRVFQLLNLNQQVAARIEKGALVTAPGIPKNYSKAKKLVTEDCVRPLRT